MKLGYSYKKVTGLQRDRGHWLAYRFDASRGFHPDSADFWVGSLDGTRMNNSIRHRFWITDLHQTESMVWASEASGHVFKNPALGLQAEWEHIALAGALQGIWGLRDDCVFTWGIHASKPIAHHWDGDRWHQVDTPGFITRVHGDSERIYAVGLRGLTAKWDGAGFQKLPSPATGTLSGVFVAGDEVHACGHGGELLVGRDDQWTQVLQHEHELNCVARWRGRWWVGAMDGLHRLEGGALENVKPNFQPHAFDARDELLITQPTHMITTADGESYTGISLEGIQLCTRGREPMWQGGCNPAGS